MAKVLIILLAVVTPLQVTAFSASDFDTMMAAAEKGDHRAQLLIGLSYFFGEYRDGSPVEKNFSEALRWLLLSAEGGDSFAQFHLGGMYYEGRGVERDKKEAAKWYLQSAKQGNVEAMANIAGMYYDGSAGQQSYDRAHAWAALAYYHGHENGKSLLQMVRPKLENIERAESLAREYFKKYSPKRKE